jgi:glutaminyl-peptide cyclotransferase
VDKLNSLRKVLILLPPVLLLFVGCPKTSKNVSPQSPIPHSKSKTSSNPNFDQDRAFMHVRKQVEIGPRPAGSKRLAKARDYITRELRSYGLKVSVDQFEAETPAGKKQMANIIAELRGEVEEVLLIASHYDTKFFKEFDFVGANDGASSTAVLLELARVLAVRKAPHHYTYRFVFFDGEEAVCRSWTECGTPDKPDNTYGSRHYVALLSKENKLKQVRSMILLDMVGYKNLELGRDELGTSWLLDVIWKTARDLNYEKYFVDRIEGVGSDDHEPFLKAGIAAVDLIQMNTYPHWHTAEDTIDKISPHSLKIVGEVVLASLPRVEEKIKNSFNK